MKVFFYWHYKNRVNEFKHNIYACIDDFCSTGIYVCEREKEVCVRVGVFRVSFFYTVVFYKTRFLQMISTKSAFKLSLIGVLVNSLSIWGSFWMLKSPLFFFVF